MNTSGAAYASMKPHIPSIKERLRKYIESRQWLGATREEAGIGCGLVHQSVNGRLRELEIDSKIVNSGRVRPQKSGRLAVVWILPEFAPEPGGEPDPDWSDPSLHDPSIYCDQECDE